MPLILEPLADTDALSIDLTGIVPDRISTLSALDIGRLEILADERPAEVGSLFRIEGDPAEGRIECRGDFSRVHFIGARMAWGEITVTGSAGRHAGEGMTGGSLTIHARAGDWLACELAGGSVRVGGNAGDNAAAALPGSPQGMRGGLVTIAGSAGSLAGARMRRGILAIGGDCGAAVAFEMRAGTVLVGGDVGPHAASGMQRGSLIAAGSRCVPPVTFQRGSLWIPSFMQLLAARLEAAGFRLGSRSVRSGLAGPWEQWHGDPLAGGRGEIFLRPTA